MQPTPLPPSSGRAVDVPVVSTPALVADPVRTRRRPVRTLAYHFWHLERWKKALLIAAVTLFVVGTAGSVAGYVRPKPAELTQARATVESLNVQARHSGLTAEQTTQRQQAVDQVQAMSHWFYDKVAPQLWRIGLGFAIAFVLGYMARQFVKTVAVLAAVILIGVGVAIYFGKLSGDKISTDLKTGSGWVADRLDAWKDQAIALATASISGTAGFIIGFTRRRG